MNIEEQIAWLHNLANGPEYTAEELKNEFAVQIERIMTRHGISKANLARSIGSSPAYITKVLRGDANVTIDTMAKLAWHTGGEVHLRITEKGADGRWFEVIDTPQTDQTACAEHWARSHARGHAA